MKHYTITIDGRKFAAVFNLAAMEAIAQMAIEDGKADPASPMDVDTVMRLGSSPYGLTRAMLVMIREGERLEGRNIDGEGIDLDWMKAHIAPGQGLWLQKKVMAIMIQGMYMETEDEDEKEVDAVLERIKKKETKAG